MLTFHILDAIIDKKVKEDCTGLLPCPAQPQKWKLNHSRKTITFTDNCPNLTTIIIQVIEST